LHFKYFQFYCRRISAVMGSNDGEAL
jgi:hypothetical protein